MYVERKSSSRAGQFWLLVFNNKDDKRKTLNELRLAGNDLSENGRKALYTLIRKISARCEHNEKYQKDEEIASCIFKSDIDDIILFMFVFASVIKETDELCDKYREVANERRKIANGWHDLFNDRKEYINIQSLMIDYYVDKYGEIDEEEFKSYLEHRQ